MIEVERKAWVDNPVDLESRVKRIARLQKKERMIDFYFTPRKESHPIDNCFRIRLEDKSAWVTFKRKKIVRRSEVNEEMNKEIRNPVLLARLLEEAGYIMFVRKEKHARIYRSRKYPGTSIELHRVSDLGNFIEVEVLCRRKSDVPRALRNVQSIFRELRIRPRDVEPRLYIELLREKQGRRKYRFRPRARSLERSYQ